MKLKALIPRFTKSWVFVDENSEPINDDRGWQGEAHILEWFNAGVIYYVGRIRPSDGKQEFRII